MKVSEREIPPAQTLIRYKHQEYKHLHQSIAVVYQPQPCWVSSETSSFQKLGCTLWVVVTASQPPKIIGKTFCAHRISLKSLELL